VRYTNPSDGGDVMPTIRAEFHRLRAHSITAARREVGSSVWQVFDGTGIARIDNVDYPLARGDLFVVPSWKPWSLRADSDFDLFRFSDAPIIERLGLSRTLAEERSR
jgi:gentisate 1,2-dioxygenase